MSLERYHQKRDFGKTPEPRGTPAKKKQAAKGFSYVIQKHAASHLHYDFRLELDGVLLSWAVPKGPSLDPSVKRLAMQTEDHPIEYGSFEGVIPKGEYGGGTVMVWDRGTWEAEGDPRSAYQKGRLTFRLHGEKLRGTWHLVRTRGKGDGDRSSWLLFKSRDTEARPGNDGIIHEQPNSVATGRSLDEIANGQSRVWHSHKRTPSKDRAKARIARAATQAKKRIEVDLSGAKSKKLPDEIEPELATLVKQAPDGDGWLHELKFDGYRLLARLDDGRVRLLTRRGQDWTHRMREIAEPLAKSPHQSAFVDGELVVLAENGISSFQLLQNSLSGDGENLYYYVFDILHLDGKDLRPFPLEERKQLLEQWVAEIGDDRIRYSDHVIGGGPAFFEKACELGTEGIVSKRRDAPYRSGRGNDWLKTKCVGRQEFVVVGYSEPSGARKGLGSLLLGVRDGKKLTYAGKVGTGFTHRSLAELYARLSPLERKTSPLDEPPREKGVHWVEPKLVAEVEFTEFTQDGRLRHPSFRGLRDDKPAAQVERDKPAPASPGQFRLTNPERVFYPEKGFTKRDLADYYLEIFRFMLPHVENRVLTLVRCPEGYQKQCFFQKHARDGMPSAIRTFDIEEKNGPETYTSIDDLEGLISLVQMGVLEVHTWGNHADEPERPDLLVLDLDPDPAVEWAKVVETAHAIRALLEKLELRSFVKTTGGKGLHVCFPIARRASWDEAKEFTQRIAGLLVKSDPSLYIANMSKQRRKGKIFIDYLRNARGASFIAPYSTRARAGAPVATPLSWDELDAKIDPAKLTIETVPGRMKKLREDPWADLVDLKQTLSAKSKRAVGM